MDIIVSSIAVIIAAGCFLAVVSSDIKETREREENDSR